jgi:ACS family tartrate transporter-like MFS transporter
MSPDLTGDAALEAATMRRVFMRLLPFLVLAYLICFIDRVNVGFAGLEMNKDLGLSQTIFGLGGGIFFIGYFLLEVPSNLALERFGASRWIARIMVSWGIISGAMALTAGTTSFLTLRFLLGAAEAGFFPGVILYLTYWFPAAHRARIVGIFMVGTAAAGFIGSPISGAILGMDGWLGVRGWQWVFILEAIPAVLMGVASLFWLTDKPEHAKWLPPEQRAWLAGRLAEEHARAKRVPHMSVWRVVREKHVLVMALVYASPSGASSGLAIWMPLIVKSYGLTNLETGFVTAVPYLVAVVLMVLWGLHSDRTRERVWHNVLPIGAIAVGLLGTCFVSSLWPMMVMLTLVVVGTRSSNGPFWALTTEFLAAPVAAAGIAQINALGNLSGFAANYLIGVIKEATGSYSLSLLPIMALAAVAAVAVVWISRGHVSVVAAE